MAVPNFQTLMLPVLRAVEQGPRKTADLVEDVSDQFGLSAKEGSQQQQTTHLWSDDTGGDTARAIGQSGDDGVDEVINLDALGVDQVYFQAKRYKTGTPVSSGAMRDFFGTLAMKDVTKGIFVTTSHFTSSADDTADKLSKRIVLIDGPTLARLMIRHSVGCRVTETFPVSTIDESYFE